MIWRIVCWLWVGLPILSFLPGVPLRLGWPWVIGSCSVGVLAVGLMAPRTSHLPAPVFGWVLAGCLGLALCHWTQTTRTFLWLCQSGILLSAAATITQHGQVKWLHQALIVCALLQVLIWGLSHVMQTPWPVHVWTRQGWGTVGNKTPAALLLAYAVCLTHGWKMCVAAALTLLTGSGTALPVVALRVASCCRQWSNRWFRVIVMTLVGGVGWSVWRTSLESRWMIWREWKPSWWGIGFKTFPSGFQDDTTLGQALGWRDYHSTYLDVVGRFGLPGLVALVGIGWWAWRRSQTPVQRWVSVLALWTGCWQSVEQFPVFIILLLVWWIVLLNGARPDAVSAA